MEWQVWERSFWDQPTRRTDDGDRTVLDGVKAALRIVPIGPGFRTVSAGGAAAAKFAPRVAPAAAKSAPGFWTKLGLGTAAVGGVATVGPYLGTRAGKTAGNFAEEVGDSLGDAVRPLAVPLLVVGAGFLAYTFLTTSRSSQPRK